LFTLPAIVHSPLSKLHLLAESRAAFCFATPRQEIVPWSTLGEGYTPSPARRGDARALSTRDRAIMFDLCSQEKPKTAKLVESAVIFARKLKLRRRRKRDNKFRIKKIC
jgi:hypothetical protein